FVGISGLRPTFGRVSCYGAVALSYSMDHIGPMCRSADDCDLVLKVISGHDSQDAGSLAEPQAKYAGAGPQAKPLRAGWTANQWKEISPDVNKYSTSAREALGKSTLVKLSTVSLPAGRWEFAAGFLVSVQASSALRDLMHAGKVS